MKPIRYSLPQLRGDLFGGPYDQDAKRLVAVARR